MFTSLNTSLPDYVSIERRKLKWARVEVAPGGAVRIVVPRLMSQRRILDIYRQREGWIDQKRARFAALANTAPLLNDDQALLWGDIYTCSFEPGVKKAKVDSDNKQIRCPVGLTDNLKFIQWHRQLGSDYLRERHTLIADQQGFAFNRLSIRNQKTRWGSCSSKQNISLNWRLIKAPVWVSDYVITHELVHTRIMNHSHAFWSRVEDHFPRFQEAKSWLSDCGHTL